MGGAKREAGGAEITKFERALFNLALLILNLE